MAAHIYVAHSEFEKDCTSTLRTLISDKVFTDVTLVAEDGNTAKAHKVILSAGSPFLKNVLIANPHPHPLIHILGVSGQILEYLIKFIYLGEVKVGEDELEKFMAVAKMMKVKGLFTQKVEPNDAILEEEKIKGSFIVDSQYAHFGKLA